MARTKHRNKKSENRQNSTEEGEESQMQNNSKPANKTVQTGSQKMGAKLSEKLLLASYLNANELPQNVSTKEVIAAISYVVQYTLWNKQTEGVKEYCICTIKQILRSQMFDFSTSHINVLCESCKIAKAALVQELCKQRDENQDEKGSLKMMNKIKDRLQLASYLHYRSECPENIRLNQILSAIHFVTEIISYGSNSKEYCVCKINQEFIDNFDSNLTKIVLNCEKCKEAKTVLRIKSTQAKRVYQKMISKQKKIHNAIVKNLQLAIYLINYNRCPTKVKPTEILNAIDSLTTSDMSKRKDLKEYCLCEIDDKLINDFDSNNAVKIVVKCDNCKQAKVSLQNEVGQKKKGSDNNSTASPQRYIVSLQDEEYEKLTSLFDEVKESQIDNTYQIQPPKLICSRIDNLFVGELVSDPKLDEQLYSELLLNESNTVDEYQVILNSVRNLPIFNKKDEIIQLIKDNQVVMINGETGCGKTTQVPQYILDDFIKQHQGSKCRIFCAEPREIYASSASERISIERNESLGKSCGYVTRYEKFLPRSSGSITFCSTSMMLNQLHHNPHLNNISHVIIDKLHEKEVMSDMLLTFLKDIMQINQSIKIILLNSYGEVDRVTQFFGNCANVNIPTELQESKEYFLEDFLKDVDYKADDLPKRNPSRKVDRVAEAEFATYIDSVQAKIDTKTVTSLKAMCYETVSLSLIISVLDHIVKNSDEESILIFLPAPQEIDLMIDMFRKHEKYKNDKEFLIVPIHSDLFSISQNVFHAAPRGCRKIVLCTDIMEMSLRINDIAFVIDCGKTVVQNFLAEKRAHAGKRVWIHNSSISLRNQVCRKEKSGVIYNLFTQFHCKRFRDKPRNTDLFYDEVIMKLKMLDCVDTYDFMSKSVRFVRPIAYRTAIDELQDIGAIDENADLTKLGYFLASFTLPLKVTKILIYGTMCACLDPVLTIAACLECKDPFTEGKAKCEFSDGSNSDLVSIANAYKSWEEADEKHVFCEENGLCENTLNTTMKLKEHFIVMLTQFGFIDSINTNLDYLNINSGNSKLVQAVVSACLYPNLSKHVYLPWDDKKKLRDAFRNSKKDTIYFFKSVCSHWDAVQHGFDFPYHVYFKNVSKDQNFHVLNLKHVSAITPLTLLLFCGSMQFCQENEIILMHEKISFHCSAVVAEKIISLRKVLDKTIDDYLKGIISFSHNNECKLTNKKSVFHTVFDLICNEKMKIFDSVSQLNSYNEQLDEQLTKIHNPGGNTGQIKDVPDVNRKRKADCDIGSLNSIQETVQDSYPKMTKKDD